MVFKIDGYSRIFGVDEIQKLIRIGDPGLEIGNDWVIGGLSLIDDQGPYVSFDGNGGSTSRINQTLNLDQGKGTNVPRLGIKLIDKDEEISELISPGMELTDILGRSCEVLIGFGGTSFPEDFVTIFRGITTDVISGPGYVTFELTAPEQLKRKRIFERASSLLASPIAGSGSVSTITLDDTSNFKARVLGADGTYDSAILHYVKINEEVFSYTGISGNTLTGCVRAQLGTSMQAHAENDDVDSFVRLQENGLIMALKVMLSGWNGPFATNIPVENFNLPSGGVSVPNSISFAGLNISRDYNVVPGDFCTVTGSSGALNDFTNKEILEVVTNADGISYIVVDDVTLVDEIGSDAVISFRSQYDTLGQGLKMSPNEVDIEQHLNIFNLYLSSFDLQIDIEEGIQGKDFLDMEVYLPMTCYSIPRKARASVGYHIGPIPGSDIIVLNTSNVLNPSTLRPGRSIKQNFFNRIIIGYNKLFGSDTFSRVSDVLDQDSIDEIFGPETFSFNSKGVKSSLNGDVLMQSASQRLLNRYKRGAEFIKGIEVLFGVGFVIEIGDIIAVDYASLKMTDLSTGTRSGGTKLMEVINKTLDFKTGKVSIDVLNTAFETDDRYCLMSPSSRVKSGSSQTQFIIKESFSADFGSNEFLKWTGLLGANVIVRNSDWSIVGQSTLLRLSGNLVTLSSNLGFVPTEDMVFEFDVYDNQPSFIKSVFGFMTDDPTFPDGGNPYIMA
jgi:hypothetical protein